jgi:hypothetical protein
MGRTARMPLAPQSLSMEQSAEAADRRRPNPSASLSTRSPGRPLLRRPGATCQLPVGRANRGQWRMRQPPHPARPSVRRPGIDTPSSRSPCPTSRTDTAVIVGLSGRGSPCRGAPPTAHADARRRKTPPQRHTITAPPQTGSVGILHLRPKTTTRRHENTASSNRRQTRQVDAWQAKPLGCLSVSMAQLPLIPIRSMA